MSFPGSPRLVKGGLVLLDPSDGTQKRVIDLQYNPDSLSRTLSPQGALSGEGDRAEAVRLKGPPVETIKLEAEMDAADGLEKTLDEVVYNGLAAKIAALETIVYPRSKDLQQNHVLSQLGTIEILPALSDLAIFVWSRNRVVPVRITEFSVTEEAFDPDLNPIRAKISLGMRVLSVNDLPFDSFGGSVFIAYMKRKETLSGLGGGGKLKNLGVEKIG